MPSEQSLLDVLIIGAGVSGIGMACTLRRECPDQRFVILERRMQLGGTWSLFRYPGVRSDSDMLTYGYAFRPWQALDTLAQGPAIRDYLQDTAQEYGLESSIRYGMEIERAEWSSETQQWTVHARRLEDRTPHHWQCRFLILGTGYFNHAAGHTPQFPGAERFAGQLVHPQRWPEDLDCANKDVVVIGSGATAATLVPALANLGARVTMLQRSPSYYLPVPRRDRLTEVSSALMPKRWAFAMARKRNVLIAHWLYQACRRWPHGMRRFLMRQVSRRLPPGISMVHFNPRYQPWDQRLCILPEGDLLESIGRGQARVITDQVREFAADHIKLESGAELRADIVVSATGLELQTFGGMQILVDGIPYEPHKHMLYKAVLMEGLPNFAWIVGYINASWTLKVDLAAAYLCRLIRRMQATNTAFVVAKAEPGQALDEAVMGALSAGYVHRSRDQSPRQGRQVPWRVTHDYLEDRKLLLHAPLEDAVLQWHPARSGLPSKV
jgi:monooxygenase